MSRNIDFFAELADGRPLSRTDPEFTEKLPITTAMLDSIDANPDLNNIVSAIATAVFKLEARDIAFD